MREGRANTIPEIHPARDRLAGGAERGEIPRRQSHHPVHGASVEMSGFRIRSKA
jgi:hypothetical protein